LGEITFKRKRERVVKDRGRSVHLGEREVDRADLDCRMGKIEKDETKTEYYYN